MGGLAITIGVGLLAGPSPSSAVVTIGEETSTPGDGGYFCSFDIDTACTMAQTLHPSRSYAAPFDGVIVRWRIRGNSFSSTLRVLRKNDGTFTGAGTSEPRTVAPDVENVFVTRLPIRQGEFIGVNVPGAGIPPFIEFRAHPAPAEAVTWSPPLADGDTRAPDGPAVGDDPLVYNADLEPDCDGDGFGDETQDPDTSSCNPPPAKADGTLTIDANKGKVEKGRKVTLSGQLDVPGVESCERIRTIEIQRRLKSEDDSKFTTFEIVQTDANGNYSTKRKVRKTYFYRAVVGETEACDDETSNSQKVRVQKKKAAQEA